MRNSEAKTNVHKQGKNFVDNNKTTGSSRTIREMNYSFADDTEDSYNAT